MRTPCAPACGRGSGTRRALAHDARDPTPNHPSGGPEPGAAPAGASLAIHASFLHRPAWPFADRFAPEFWPDRARGIRTAVEAPSEAPAAGRPVTHITPSLGPGLRPEANLVPMLGSVVLVRLTAERGLRFAGPVQLRRDWPMPGTLDTFGLAFTLDRA